MKIYVAARNFTFAQEVMELLRRELGATITLDWTGYPPGTRDSRIAEMMRLAVEAADAVVLCGVEDKMLGALLEVGMALGLRKRVIVFGGGAEPRDSLFWRLPEVQVCASEEILVDLVAEVGR
jgi:hypothetical protein